MIEQTLRLWEHYRDINRGVHSSSDQRSPSWRSFRNDYIAEECFCCGSKKDLTLHHIIPFNIAPELELEIFNCVTLCDRKKYGINCHLLIGHLGNFRRWNPFVLFEAAWWRMRLVHQLSTGDALVQAEEYLKGYIWTEEVKKKVQEYANR